MCVFPLFFMLLENTLSLLHPLCPSRTHVRWGGRVTSLPTGPCHYPPSSTLSLLLFPPAMTCVLSQESLAIPCYFSLPLIASCSREQLVPAGWPSEYSACHVSTRFYVPIPGTHVKSHACIMHLCISRGSLQEQA